MAPDDMLGVVSGQMVLTLDHRGSAQLLPTSYLVFESAQAAKGIEQCNGMPGCHAQSILYLANS
jgi:hypothetical protein